MSIPSLVVSIGAVARYGAWRVIWVVPVAFILALALRVRSGLLVELLSKPSDKGMNIKYSLMKSLSRLLVFVILLFLGCKRDSQVYHMKTATLDEVEKATFTICNYDRSGAGVFVGYSDEGKDRIFFLTARHVATSSNVSETLLEITLGTQKRWSVRSDRERWYTSRCQCDAAWFELTGRERTELMELDSLRYISLFPTLMSQTGGMVRGACAMPLRAYALTHRSETPETAMFYRECLMDGRLCLSEMLYAEMPFQYNKVFKQCKVEVVPALCRRKSTPGDSGGAAFMRVTVDGVETWVLAGLVIGGCTNVEANAIQPLDVVIDEIIHTPRKLSDQPELW